MPTFSCNIVYQHIDCGSGLIPFYAAVKRAGGNGMIFTTWHTYQGELQDLLNLTNSLLSIPIILVVEHEDSEIWLLKDEVNVTIQIEVIDPSSSSMSSSTSSSGLDTSRSAMTFYFIVFAFTILLLLYHNT